MGPPKLTGTHRSRAWRDLIVVVLAAGLSFWLFMMTDAAGAAQAWLERTFSGRYDEVILGFALSTLALGLLAALRWRDAARHLAARHAAEERYRAVVEKIPAVTYTWDPTRPPGASRVLYVSPQVQAIFGFSVQDWTSDPELWMRQIHAGIATPWSRRRSAPTEPASRSWRSTDTAGRTAASCGSTRKRWPSRSVTAGAPRWSRV